MNGIEVGKDVICIKSHSQGAVILGEIYTVNAIKKYCCDFITIDIGKKPIGCFDNCPNCLSVKINNDGIWWLSIELFAPLGDISELEELLKEQKQTA